MASATLAGMRLYMRVLAVFYFIGFVFHAMDIFSLRLPLNEMSGVWKIWIIYLLVFDLLAAVGLWLGRAWGVALFLLIASSQLIAYLGFQSVFGKQTALVVFHIATLTIYFFVLLGSGSSAKSDAIR